MHGSYYRSDFKRCNPSFTSNNILLVYLQQVQGADSGIHRMGERIICFGCRENKREVGLYQGVNL